MKKTIYAFGFGLLLAFSAGIDTAFAQTGDQLIDNIIAGFTHKAANSTTASHLDLGKYPDPIACNSSSAASHEQNCPSDVTYSPSSFTGGGQAFGVGITNYPGGFILYAVPYLVYSPHWDPYCDCYVDWIVYWDIYLVDVPPISRGVAVAASTWGDDPYPALHPSIPLSTMAFKYNGLVERCDPDYTGTQAPCGGFRPESDVTYIDGAGYEDKIYIQESCSIQRTDTINDAYAGCFLSLEGWTTLPAPVYLDTTAEDAGHTYAPGIGVVSPASINEGTKYYWYIYFGAYGNEPITGQKTAQHRNAITYHVGYSPFCLAYKGTFGEAACYFNVDNTPLSPASTIQ